MPIFCEALAFVPHGGSSGLRMSYAFHLVDQPVCNAAM